MYENIKFIQFKDLLSYKTEIKTLATRKIRVDTKLNGILHGSSVNVFINFYIVHATKI